MSSWQEDFWQPIARCQPELIPLAQQILERLQARYPEAPIVVQRSQIKIGYGGGFCWLWPPFRRKRGWPKQYLFLSFGLRRPLEHPRVVECAHPAQTRWTVHTLVERIDQLDEELLGWLDEAWADNQTRRK